MAPGEEYDPALHAAQGVEASLSVSAVPAAQVVQLLEPFAA